MKEKEWVIDYKKPSRLFHNEKFCSKEGKENSNIFSFEIRGGGIYEIRKIEKSFVCCWCRESIPDYIVFQWKLLNEK